MLSGYQEAIIIINDMIYANRPEPTKRRQGTDFDVEFTQQWNKRQQVNLTNEEIKSKLEALNALFERRQKRQEEIDEARIQTGKKRKPNMLNPELNKAVDALEEELHAYVLYNTLAHRYQVSWTKN